jgi:hypothetical protein
LLIFLWNNHCIVVIFGLYKIIISEIIIFSKYIEDILDLSHLEVFEELKYVVEDVLLFCIKKKIEDLRFNKI